MNGSSETGEQKTSQSPINTENPECTNRQDMLEPSETKEFMKSGDTEESEEPPVDTEIQESIDQAMAGPSETQESMKSGDTEESEEPQDTTEILKSIDKAITQDMPGPSETQESIKSGDTEKSEEPPVDTEIQESIDKAITQDVPGPSETQESIKSGDTEEFEEPPVDLEIQESTDKAMAGPSETQESIKSGDAEESEGPPDEENDSQISRRWDMWPRTWDISQVQPFSWFYAVWSFCSYLIPVQAAQTQKEESNENLCGDNIGASGNKDDVNADDDDDDEEEARRCGFEIIKKSEPKVSDYPSSKTETSFEEKIGKIKEILGSSFSIIWFLNSYHSVGIFSRSSEFDYEWLIKALESNSFQSAVSAVRPHYISNNGMVQFMDAVTQCTFGILYHTKNRGRVNITDVTDSLYDEELRYMSERLGSENVIVVVDDLKDNSDEEKERILRNQPSIRRLAKDTFLFSTDDKQKMTAGAI